MSPKNNDHGETTTNLDDPAKPVGSNLKSGPYLSPLNSPSKNKRVSVDKDRTVEAFNSHLLSPPSSPPQQSSELAADEKQAKEDAIDTITLKALLGLTNGLCGAFAKTKGRPCERRSPAPNKAAAASQLESMVTLTNSSVDLEDKLNTLASLVHCKSHDAGLPKKDRIEAWKKAFPIGEVTVTNPIILVEQQIRQLLALKPPTTCFRVVEDTNTKCNQGIGGLRVNHCTLTINDIITSRAYLSDSHLEGLLEVLERSMYCPAHTKEKNLHMLASWKSSIAGFLVTLPKKEISEDYGDPSEDSSTDSEPKNPLSNNSGSLIKSERLSIPNFDQDLSTYWPVIYNTSPFEIVERSKNLADHRSSYRVIKQRIDKPLVHPRHGYIYMYEVEGNPGFVKIGCTTQSVDKRLKDWEFDCNRAPKVLYPIPSSTAELVPHVRHVEALCHAELNHRRIRIHCPGCLIQHLEWFEVSSMEAIKVIQKWSTWMKTEPYKPPALRSGQKWICKIEEIARLERMDNFMDEVSAAS
ncbi:hypothetical protein FVEN_g8127 [Fusarium venenatum]|uniref:Bacteriophage T5 Orf172 DNA-binding domain-containing protein n=1 Tax=Fusarium venenatum TaxID=56646 RepID=A0A2L2SYV0_9HYPO|nr:uncharacterized protein FVRRES_04519 [Fusarium venenatum]KAG8353863.1 hypothetical protein FVEN_g8127 [Fusarium venenatum]KAH6991680.1 T5orf172 domain-containing protein [Fusarium venenatum]CEI60083.1 unnamed protein product [Fusarium venenatum]